MKILPLLCAFSLGPLVSLSQNSLSDSDYRVYSVQLRQEVSLEHVAEAMKDCDVLFFGEEHNDSVAHFAQLSLLKLMQERFGTHMALSMEMFDRDVQGVMNEYLGGHIREKNFLKDARVWSNYSDYRPLVEFAKEKTIPVVCANAAGRYSNLAGRKGIKGLLALPPSSRQWIAPLPYDTASGPYYDKLIALTGHTPSSDSTAAKQPPMGGFNLILGQSLWDATMAWSIAAQLKKNKGSKILQVNGRFHSDEGFAAVTQLRRYRPKTKILVLSSGSDDSFPTITWEAHQHLGDFILITNPKVPRTYEQ